MSATMDRLPPVEFPADLFDGVGTAFPVTALIVELLSQRSPDVPRRQVASAELDAALDAALRSAYDAGDPTALQDVQQALFAIYETSFANPLSPACTHEWAPWLVAVRERMERTWLASDLATLDVPTADACRRMTTDEVRDWFLRAAAEESTVDRDVVGYLEHHATVEDYKLFVRADAHLNFRFYDALVLSLIHYSEPVKTEISEHFWEEAGEGAVDRSHTRQFSRSLERLGLGWELSPTWDDWRPFAGYNLYLCLGLARRHYFKALGSLAMPELFDVARDQAIVNGLRRLGFDPEHDFEYYWNHVEADAEHGPGWLNGVILPIVAAQPEATHELIVGAALRMQAMRRFNAFLAERLLTTPERETATA
jgi:heme oxygenase-like protein